MSCNLSQDTKLVKIARSTNSIMWLTSIFSNEELVSSHVGLQVPLLMLLLQSWFVFKFTP